MKESRLQSGKNSSKFLPEHTKIVSMEAETRRPLKFAEYTLGKPSPSCQAQFLLTELQGTHGAHIALRQALPDLSSPKRREPQLTTRFREKPGRKLPSIA